MLGFSNHRTPAVSSEPPCSPASHPELFYVESGGGTVHSLEARTPPRPVCTPPSVSSGAEKLGAEKDGWEGKAGTDPAKMEQHGGLGACQQGALLFINEI